MQSARRHHFKPNTPQISPLLRLWLLRILVPLGGYRGFVQGTGFTEVALAEALGLGRWVDPPHGTFDANAVRSELRKLHWSSERSGRPDGDQLLRANIARLAKLVGLDETSIEILELAVLTKTNSLLSDAADQLGQLSSLKACNIVSGILSRSETEVRSALSSHGTLAQSGLLVVDRSGSYHLSRKFDLLSGDFPDSIESNESDPLNLLRNSVRLSSPGELEDSDYDHIGSSLAILRAYLKMAITTRRKGVNIFLHGKPGTGKNQLAKLLARQMGCELLEVASEDSDGDPIDGEHRLRAFRAAQCIFANRVALILFDEVEDVFNDVSGLFGQKSVGQTHKAWINRILEENPVPTLWLSNSVGCLDPAFIRRFDMIFELPVPPRSKRATIIEKTGGGMLDTRAAARLAECEVITPAVITRAASVVGSIREQLGEADSSTAIELLIGNTLEAQGHEPVRWGSNTQLPETYDPAFINADVDLAGVTRGLVKARSGRLCLFGPPGTGKTAYARWLAGQLGAPLSMKRASDLMSMWVGENEQNIARAFRQAERERAVLLIDEVDSFLRDRRGARSGWEVTLVNEMLTQMESFSGVFIASTNLMEGLDQAALRRFDVKARFDFLTPDQAWELLGRHCVLQGLPELAPNLRRQVGRLASLTPGDFAVVASRQRFECLADASAWITALEAECALKSGGKSPIGFV